MNYPLKFLNDWVLMSEHPRRAIKKKGEGKVHLLFFLILLLLSSSICDPAAGLSGHQMERKLRHVLEAKSSRNAVLYEKGRKEKRVGYASNEGHFPSGSLISPVTPHILRIRSN